MFLHLKYWSIFQPIFKTFANLGLVPFTPKAIIRVGSAMRTCTLGLQGDVTSQALQVYSMP